jgi:uncharacterized protein YndB with AHSA1/START domain
VAKVKNGILIHAPVEEVFAYVDDPINLPEVWPSMIEATNLERLADGRKRHEWVYKMAGIRFNGRSEDVEWVSNERIVTQTSGIDSTLVWTFQPEGDGTRVTLETTYTIPVPVLGRLAEAITIKLNENEGAVLMANLKAKLEG